jgi:hypothetical protein
VEWWTPGLLGRQRTIGNHFYTDCNSQLHGCGVRRRTIEDGTTLYEDQAQYLQMAGVQVINGSTSGTR